MPKVLYLVTEDWYFCSHRMSLARAAAAKGYEVAVATRVANHGDAIAAEGFELVPIALRRRNANPWRELGSIAELAGIYRRLRPDIVHHVALKPVVYGSVAAAFVRGPRVVNALAGLGFVFTSQQRGSAVMRMAMKALLRLLLARRGARVIVQNPDDRDSLVRMGLPASRMRLIKGSGVDPGTFSRASPAPGTPIVTLVSRMLWDKGVGEFVEAARTLRSRGVAARMVLVGAPDEGNPNTVPESRLIEWVRQGVVEWWGHRDDVADVWRQSTLATLPSYREGLPRALLEAACSSLPMVAADAPGCREIVRHEETGLLVPVRDAPALAGAIECLLSDSDLRARLGRRARDVVMREFSDDIVNGQILSLYEELA